MYAQNLVYVLYAQRERASTNCVSLRTLYIDVYLYMNVGMHGCIIACLYMCVCVSVCVCIIYIYIYIDLYLFIFAKVHTYYIGMYLSICL